ncbi:MAG: c-type cytochrome [Verrucomicrobiaceae bacterium]|nr:c-type cytochrome [Verrucomicrobiaceae bacterium]
MRSFFFLLCLPVVGVFAEDFPTPFNSEKGDPMPAEEVARTMALPEGFRCQVFAAEPEVQQPIAMAWDAKSRLWVAENYTYAENPSRWNTDMRDRIIILEDKDGDGKADGRKVFWDRGSYLTSVETGFGGVWILNAGTLSFIPDKNGDDIPDGEPEVLLDGFNVKTIGHNIVNGLRWGPDGWLYGRHGITDTSAVGAPGTPLEKRTKLNCAIWRFHPVTRKFEVVCHGGTNSWGHDWNAEGELFWINTVIGHLWHGIPGAYYRRMFGSHLNPYVYEIIEQTADHFHWDAGAEKWSDIRTGISNKTKELGGGHAHVGLLIYQGGAWPKEYEGAMLTCNLHGNRINMDRLVREGCGYVGKHDKDFMQAQDKWFRGLDLLTGPDGNVFVSDWSDTGECHDSDGIHRTSGRIYKIVYGTPKAQPAVDLGAMDEAALTAAVTDHATNNWWARMAARVRADRGQMPAEKPLPTLADASSTDGLVRLHLASSMQSRSLDERWPIAMALAQHAEDANDRQQSLMIWYGIEPAVPAAPEKALELISVAKIATVRRLVSRRLAEEIERQPAAVDGLVKLILAKADLREDVLAGLAAGLEGFSSAKKPEAWDALEKAVGGAGQGAEVMRQLSVLFGSGRAVEELIAIIENTDGDANARRNAFASVTRQPKPELMLVIRKLINDKILGTVARSALAAFDDPSIPKALTNAWPVRSEEQQAATVATLVSRPAYADVLLDAIKDGKVPRAALTPFHARQIGALGDEALANKLTAVWGEVRESPAEKIAELARWKAILTPEALAKADKSKGRTVFVGACSACHKLYGQGGAIAPELTGSDRHNLNYLLENILDPSAVVPADYRMSVFKLKDGRILSGVVPAKTDRSLTIQTLTERMNVELSQIVEQQQLPASLMPEGLLPALGEEQVTNLIAYLMGNEQVEPATK